MLANLLTLGAAIACVVQGDLKAAGLFASLYLISVGLLTAGSVKPGGGP